MSQYIARQMGWLAAPLLLIVALAPLFVMLFVLCGLFVNFSQQIAIFDPTNTSAQTFSESLRLPETKLSAVAGRLVLAWLAVVTALTSLMQSAPVLLFWTVVRLATVRKLTMMHTSGEPLLFVRRRGVGSGPGLARSRAEYVKGKQRIAPYLPARRRRSSNPSTECVTF